MPEKLSKASLEELRQMWGHVWGREPHSRIGRTMLEKSLQYQHRVSEGYGLRQDQQARLAQLIKQYKRNSGCFDLPNVQLKPGTRLVRMHGGKKHNVLIKADGF